MNITSPLGSVRLRLGNLLGSDTTLRGQLLRGARSSLLLKISEAALGFMVSLVLARILQPEGYGVYSFALSVVGILGVPVMMGLPTLVLRETARYHATGEWALLRGILIRAFQAVAFLSALVGPLVAIAVWNWPDRIEQVQVHTLMWALILIPLTGFNRLRESTLLGLAKVRHALTPERLLLPILMLAAVGLYQLLGVLDPPGAMALYCGATAIALVLGARYMARDLPPGVRECRAAYANAYWFRSVLPLALLGGLNVILSQTDIFMLGLYSTKTDVGLYRVAFNGAALVLFFHAAINQSLQSHFVTLYASADRARLQRLITTATRGVTLAALPVAAALVVFGGDILEFAYGVAYRPAYPTLIILSLAQLFNVFTGSVYDILNMTGHEHDTLKGVMLSAVTNVALNAVLIPLLGPAGAALATGISMVLVNGTLVAILRARTGLWSPAAGYSLVSRRRG